MKITCSKEDLYKGLNITSKAVPTRTTMPILECILVDASTNDIRLTANDTEIGIETIIPGNIEERGKVALDAKIFFDMIRSMPDNNVTITTDENYHTKIVCEKAHFDISGKSGEDFPYIPVIPRNIPIEISQFTLRETIRQTIFSTSINDGSHMMSGELFEIKGSNLRVASLDGHRISIRNIALNNSYDDSTVIVPAKALDMIAKTMNGSVDDNTNIYITDNHIIFEFDSTTLVSRLIEGDFFNVDNMLSKNYETKLSLNRKDWMESISRAMLLVSEVDKKPLVFDVRENDFLMRVNSIRGRFEENINMIKEGRDIKIAFNPRFILDVLRVVDDENINVYLLSPTSPCFIRNENEDYIYLILPVNFNE